MIQEINFCIVNKCNANCVFCPKPSSKKQKKQFMDIELIKHILKETQTDYFKNKHKYSNTVIGENGEATLHPKFLDILRLFKGTGIGITLFTNFSGFNEVISQAIINERLVNAIHLNIDGASSKTYRAIKGIDYNNLVRNLEKFIEFRSAYGNYIPMYIHTLTAEHINKALVKNNWDTLDIPEIENEHQEVINKWHDPENKIYVNADSVLMWNFDGPNKQDDDYSCFNLNRLYTNVFINPKGDWYACCFDVNNELVLGNVYKQTLDEIYESDKRKNLINKLENKKFKDIGEPCASVHKCQVVHWE